ncbi:MAG: hypothetical protein NTZ22_08190 [Hyphomicrobiales bacterium]|nr:hypothetical protein [Hyphomicrobiales bacterium]
MKTRIMLLLAVVMGLTCGAQAEENQRFHFGLWGDMPYAKARDELKMPALLASINTGNIAFSLYDGDIKDGSSHCTDKVFADALTMFNSMTMPVIYIPGDNEWTDCHRLNNGGYDTQERLATLRKVMFATPGSLGKKRMPLQHQGKTGEKFVENTRFTYGNIVFVTLNIPGSNNNKVLDDRECTDRSARTPTVCATSNAEYLERDVANIAWLKEGFALAKSQKSPGLVVAFQADPGFDLPETEIDERQHPSVSGYTQFLAQLVSETEQFKGQVLLVHGDTHYFKVDKPLYNPAKALPNLTRVQTFGSPSIHWVRVSVDPRTPNVFSIQPVMVKH